MVWWTIRSPEVAAAGAAAAGGGDVVVVPPESGGAVAEGAARASVRGRPASLRVREARGCDELELREVRRAARKQAVVGGSDHSRVTGQDLADREIGRGVDPEVDGRRADRQAGRCRELPTEVDHVGAVDSPGSGEPEVAPSDQIAVQVFEPLCPSLPTLRGVRGRDRVPGPILVIDEVDAEDAPCVRGEHGGQRAVGGVGDERVLSGVEVLATPPGAPSRSLWPPGGESRCRRPRSPRAFAA